MDEILSQHEIDSLLSAMSSGEVKIEVKQEVDGRNIKIMIFAVRTNFLKTNLILLNLFMMIFVVPLVLCFQDCLELR